MFLKNGSRATFVLWDGWIVFIKRVYIEGTVFMAPAVNECMYFLTFQSFLEFEVEVLMLSKDPVIYFKSALLLLVSSTKFLCEM